ncbi:MAG: hypothetical protein VXZ84_11095 [Planctomycetota bacterium]|nr:hypothetical protein [Planctomycetota bacterium]
MLKKIYPAMAILLSILLGSTCTLLISRALRDESVIIGVPHGVHASTASGTDGFSVATGPIDENVEGLFLLDGLTGDLTCSVVSVFNGKFFARMQRNVLNDLSLDNDKNTRLLMVTGSWRFRSQTSQRRPSNSLVYVVDSSSGNYAAYAVPWNKLAANKGRQGNHVDEIILLDKGTARDPTAN